jgi:hypothetical protein
MWTGSMSRRSSVKISSIVQIFQRDDWGMSVLALQPDMSYKYRTWIEHPDEPEEEAQ